MITSDPYGIRYACAPWVERFAAEDLLVSDPPERIAVCTACTMEECRMESVDCPLNGKKNREKAFKKCKSRKTPHEKMLERDEIIRDMIHAGWRNDESICEKLGISKSTLYGAKRRLRDAGEIR